MNPLFMGQCAPNAAYLAVSSLNYEVRIDSDDHLMEVGDLIADPTPNQEAVMENNQLRDRVRRFVCSLNPHLSCIAIRHYWLDQNQSEIADSLGVSRSAVCHAIRRINELAKRSSLLANT